MFDSLPAADETLDAGKTACGDLILLIAKAMRTMTAGQVLHVIAYDRGAAEDIPAWCRITNNALLLGAVPKDAALRSHFYVRKG